MSEPTPDRVPLAKTREKDRRSKKNRKDLTRALYTRHFVGRIEGLERDIYDIGTSNQADMVMQTTKKITNYAEHTLKEYQDTRLAIENVEDANVPRLLLKLAANTKKDLNDKSSTDIDINKAETKFNELIYLNEIDTHVKSLDE